MTDKATDVAVTQADRERAGDLYEVSHIPDPCCPPKLIAQKMRDGKLDESGYVQAFAAHRIASEQPASGETIDPDDLETLIDDAISDSLDMDWTSMMGARAVAGAFEHVGWSVVKGRPLSTTSEAPEAGRLREIVEALSNADCECDPAYSVNTCLRCQAAAALSPCEGAE